DLASVDAGVHLDWIAGRVRQRAVADRERGPYGPLGVVLVGDRRPENGQYAVAHHVDHSPTVAVDLVGHALSAAMRQHLDVLRIEPLGEGGKARQIGEQHRYPAALPGPRRHILLAGAGERLGRLPELRPERAEARLTRDDPG